MEITPSDWATIVQFSQFQAGFLSRTSHELRSPLSSLMSLHQLILNDLCDSPEEERDCIRQAYEAANRLLRMLELVTQVSKLEVGLEAPEFEVIAIQILLDDLAFLTNLQAKNRNVILQIESLSEETLSSFHFESDYRILRQILVGLVESSIAIIAPGQIRIWCEFSLEAGWFGLNLASTPPLGSWQQVSSLLEQPVNTESPLDEIPEFVPEIFLAKLRSSPDPSGASLSLPSHFSLEYSLMISQLLLQKIKGTLQLIQSDQPDQPFYLQCRFNLSPGNASLS
ncbi:MAG: sensor histidine kinase [Prochlorotrichaceae cyanobacterium]